MKFIITFKQRVEKGPRSSRDHLVRLPSSKTKVATVKFLSVAWATLWQFCGAGGPWVQRGTPERYKPSLVCLRGLEHISKQAAAILKSFLDL